MFRGFSIFFFLFPLLAQATTIAESTYSYTPTHYYPIDHIRGVFITDTIIQFLRLNNSNNPGIHTLAKYKSAMALFNPTNLNCQLCPKQFSNMSYLALHYTLKHPQIYDSYDHAFTPHFQLLFSSQNSIPASVLLDHCMWFYESMLEHRLQNVNKIEFCQIVCSGEYLQSMQSSLVAVVGLTGVVVVIVIIGAVYFSRTNTKRGRKKSN